MRHYARFLEEQLDETGAMRASMPRGGLASTERSVEENANAGRVRAVTDALPGGDARASAGVPGRPPFAPPLPFDNEHVASMRRMADLGVFGTFALSLCVVILLMSRMPRICMGGESAVLS